MSCAIAGAAANIAITTNVITKNDPLDHPLVPRLLKIVGIEFMNTVHALSVFYMSFQETMHKGVRLKSISQKWGG
jgi:hypothetical protein